MNEETAKLDAFEIAAQIAEAEPEPEGIIPISLLDVDREELVRATVRAVRKSIAIAIRDFATRYQKEQMMVLSCTCKHDAQDKMYGPGKRCHNPLPDKGSGVRWRCTVCASERDAGRRTSVKKAKEKAKEKDIKKSKEKGKKS